MTAATSAPLQRSASSDIVASVFHSASVSESLAILVAETVGTTQRLSWANQGAVTLLGYALEDLRSVTVRQLLPTLGGGELSLLLRRERASQMTVPVRSASGALVEATVLATPSPNGEAWTLRVAPVTASAHEEALQATADAHERRFATLTERSPVPTLLSEQGMRLSHVNDAFCGLVGRQAEQLLGTGWLQCVHPDDLDDLTERVADALEGGDVELRARLVRQDGAVRTTVIRFAHLFTPGAGAGFVGTIEDVTDRLAFEARLAHQATHDPLTGLPNRTRLAEYVAGRFVAGTSRLACLFLDLDNFKVVNDSLGHAAGDELLAEVADRLRATVRPDDMVARFGGDEFVVICDNGGENGGEAGAVALAERIVAVLSRPVRIGGVDIRPHASVGVTVQTPEHVAAEELVRDCDIAMYQAKAGGKRRITVLDQQGRAEARDKLRLVAELRDAIERREISLAYQPIFDAGSRTAVAVESLARWEHPVRGTISPVVFVSLAEESGLIASLGHLVLDETCRQMVAWDAELGAAAPAKANVNVSALQLDETLPDLVAATLQRHGLQPGRLSVEITESALMTDPEAARTVLEQLRGLGVQIAIDDFGTGYSSLAYLRHLPVDCLKVDRSFVAELTDGHAEIASAVIALAANLNLCTVAEGVETVEQAAELGRLGATYLQGFSLARPMTGSAAAAFFAACQETPVR